MKLLERMNHCGIVINWGTFLIGWNGSAGGERRICPEDIRAYALERLETTQDRKEIRLLSDLATTDGSGGEELLRQMRYLADRDGFDNNREIRKWRFVLLDELLTELPSDPLYGLLGLSDFWAAFDYPEDSPHTVQARGNMGPVEYYTDANFREILSRHRAWMDKELPDLRVALTN